MCPKETVFLCPSPVLHSYFYKEGESYLPFLFESVNILAYRFSSFKQMDYHDNETEWFSDHCSVKMDYKSQRISLFLLHLFMFIVGLAMNVTAVWVNWHRRHSRNTVLFCLLNIGLADTMMVIMLPIYMLEVVMEYAWLWGDFLCRFSNLVMVVSIDASSFFLAYMSVERYLALMRGSAPKVHGMPEKRKRIVACATLWMLALFLGLMEMAHTRTMGHTKSGCFVMPEYAYREWFTSLIVIHFFLQFMGPAAIISTFNVLAAQAVRACPEVQAHNTDSVRLLHVYSLVFVLCWLPYQLIMILLLVDFLKPNLFNCNTVEQVLFSFTVVRATALLHCLANPILYNFLSRSFRSKLTHLILYHLPQDVIPKEQTDQHGHDVDQREAAINGTKASNMDENSTSQSES